MNSSPPLAVEWFSFLTLEDQAKLSPHQWLSVQMPSVVV
ncbi:hypothetical protein A2U01_0105949, partial [Trifolium medium]|nr:hypothetical protein [Trifolium medium]